jgi:hypothetical protein
MTFFAFVEVVPGAADQDLTMRNVLESWLSTERMLDAFYGLYELGYTG